MIKPTIHLNGTNAKDLMEGYLRARQAVREAIKAVGQTYPNGRDYYLQGGTVIYRAMEEHEARLRKLQTVYDELGELLDAVDRAANI